MTHDATEVRHEDGSRHVTRSGVIPRGLTPLDRDPGVFRRNGVSGMRRLRPSRGCAWLARSRSPDRASGVRRRAGVAGVLVSAAWTVAVAMTLFALLPFGSAPAAAGTGVRLDGPRTQGGLLRGRVPPGSTVEYEGDAVRVSAGGWFLVGFGRDAPPEAELVVVFPRWPARAAGAPGRAARVRHPANRRSASEQGDAERGGAHAHPRRGQDGQAGPGHRRSTCRLPQRLPLADQGSDQRCLRLAAHSQRRAAPAALRHRHRRRRPARRSSPPRTVWSPWFTRTCSSPAAP